MNATQIPNAFAGDTLVEDTSISNLILRGMEKDAEVFGSTEMMRTLTMDTIPLSVRKYLDQSSVKVETSSVGGTVRADFLLPGLTNYIGVLGHIYYNSGDKSSLRLNGCSWFYFKLSPGKYSDDKIFTVAESMEHAIYKAYEEEKKGSVV